MAGYIGDSPVMYLCPVITTVTAKTVYRFGVWYINGSTAGPIAMQFGLNSDIPIPKKYIP